MTTEENKEERRMSGFEKNGNFTPIQEFSRAPVGQSCPEHYPQASDTLGEPLSILEVARLIGCSAWTIRHRYLPQGLPHFRSGPAGKLVFFRNQVVAWILQQQQKGGR